MDVDSGRAFDRVCRHLTPVFVVVFVVYWLALYLRQTWTKASLWLLLGGCLAGETVAQTLLLSAKVEEGDVGGGYLKTSTRGVNSERIGPRVLHNDPRVAGEGSTGTRDDQSSYLTELSDLRGVEQMSLTMIVLLFASAASFFSSLEAAQGALVICLIGLLRFMTCAQLDALPPSLRPFAGYLGATLAVAGARYTQFIIIRVSSKYKI